MTHSRLRTFATLAPILLPFIGITASAQQILPWPACSADNVRGYYGYHAEGTIFMQPDPTSAPVPLPSSMIGMMSIDMSGNVSGTAVAIVGPQTMEGDLVNGKIQVNPDCTGTATFYLQPSGQSVIPVQGLAKLVVLDYGSSIILEYLKPTVGIALVGVVQAHRISR